MDRHNTALAVLAADGDPRYRPSSDLCALVSGTELDRPLVPLLNALVEQGLDPLFSCADDYIALDGIGAAQIIALASAGRRLPHSRLRITEEQPEGRVGRRRSMLEWERGDLSEPDLDARLLTAAQALEPTGLHELTPDVEQVFAQLRAVGRGEWPPRSSGELTSIDGDTASRRRTATVTFDLAGEGWTSNVEGAGWRWSVSAPDLPTLTRVTGPVTAEPVAHTL